MLASDQDTIVAVATAPGEGAIGIVRLSGPRALAVAASCFRGARSLLDLEDRKLTLGRFVDGSQDLDQVLASVMRAPRSYTGEDTVEFNCHGGPLILGRIVQALLRQGARPAERGEYTKRAFLNGRIDLTQAEAVADMIAARTDAGLRSAYFQLRGGLHSRFLALAEALRDIRTVLEAGLDFSEDVPVDPAAIGPALQAVRRQVGEHLAGYAGGKLIREGARVALCGRPNVGKSSLLNRLLGQERAIVTEIPGTTRDTIEEGLHLEGLAVSLVDTAGIRETSDPIERAGTERSRLAMGSADLVLLVVDGSADPQKEDISLVERTAPLTPVLVLNKQDLGSSTAWDQVGPGTDRVTLSAITGEGVEGLRALIRSRLLGSYAGNAELVTHDRHAEALRRADAHLGDARAALAAGQPGEIIALEVDEALGALGEIVGETTAQDVLDRIFARFCVGK